MRAIAGAWNFGLCATRSREPRQARKGATVPGMPRVPQITRSSSRREKLSALSSELYVKNETQEGRRLILCSAFPAKGQAQRVLSGSILV